MKKINNNNSVNPTCINNNTYSEISFFEPKPIKIYSNLEIEKSLVYSENKKKCGVYL